jgi:hypothetical protein
MSNDVTPIQEVEFIGLTDEKLLDLLGFLHEEIKNIDERLKVDETIAEMAEELAQYKKENYTDTQKVYKAKLKAVRRHAQTRGLKFTPPDGKYK